MHDMTNESTDTPIQVHVLGADVRQKLRDERLEWAWHWGIAALSDALQEKGKEPAEIPAMVQRISAGNPTPEDQAVLDALPRPILDALAMTAAQFAKAIAGLMETQSMMEADHGN